MQELNFEANRKFQEKYKCGLSDEDCRMLTFGLLGLSYLTSLRKVLWLILGEKSIVDVFLGLIRKS